MKIIAVFIANLLPFVIAVLYTWSEESQLRGIICCVICAGYLIPSYIAAVKNAKNFKAIFFLNLTFGWSLIGWISSMIWASVDKSHNAVASEEKEQIPLDAAPSNPAE